VTPIAAKWILSFGERDAATPHWLHTPHATAAEAVAVVFKKSRRSVRFGMFLHQSCLRFAAQNFCRPKTFGPRFLLRVVCFASFAPRGERREQRVNNA
jgi:hypothetical protein